MRTAIVVLLLATLLAMVGSAQPAHEHAAEAAIEHATGDAAGHAVEHSDEHAGEHGEDHSSVDLWKTVNFTILALILGWAIRKFGGKFFQGQTAKIQQGIVEAKQMKADAEARAAEMERRMERLDADIAELRTSARDELAAEEVRLQAQTEQLVARVRTNARQEIASAAKQARNDVRSYASKLALELAHQKVRERITPEVSAALIERLGNDLDQMSRRVN